MKYVDFYKLQNDGTQKVVLQCIFDENNISFKGEDLVLAENLKTQGVKDYITQGASKTLLPADGLIFLENLKHNFKSEYLNASEVMSN